MIRGGSDRGWVFAWLAFLPIAVLRAGNLAESDTFWQVRTGIDMLTSRELPTVDPYSWTAYGAPWTLNSWGFDLLLGALYRAGGLDLVAWFGAVMVMAIAALALVLARRSGAAPGAAAVVLLLASVVLVGWLSVRPQLVDYAAVLLLVMLLQDVSGRLRWGWSVLAVGVLMAAWVNLHAAVLLGVAVVAVFAATLVVDPRQRENWNRGLIALAASLIGAAINPYGTAVLTQASQVQEASSGVVDEWAGFDWTSPGQAAVLLLGGIALTASVRRGDASLMSALGVGVVGAALALRMQPVLLIVAVPALAALASSTRVLGYVTSRRAILYPGAAVGLVLLTALAVPSLTHIGRPDPFVYPVAAHESIPSGCRMFNSYLLGGYLILHRPDVAVSIDSRNDVYGPEPVVAGELALSGGADPTSALAGADCVLVSPTSGLARQLEKDSDWRTEVSEPAAVLFLRRAAGA